MNTLFWLAYPAFAFGLAYVLGWSVASKKLRDWLHGKGVILSLFIEMIECPACLGFWIGVGTGGWMLGGPIQALFIGFTTAGTNFILARFTDLIPPPKD
jgi:hypothetical protein